VEGGSATDAEATAQANLNAVSIQAANIVVSPSTITSQTSVSPGLCHGALSSNTWVVPFYFDGLNITSDMTLSSG
jgi:hypothetical protein